ncbi:DinB family protein [Brevibacillus fulvus]|uniref:Damage-inducible protein DinB n=1 Tax=Brevibacillus fulvus TaxID=1125967 RepID=A0A939BS95_9BACL|nr:DinB family protein [Brevibacillus fulvus]MBM7590238.1 putative damage-inducible protein DinB [Brevibacillus fulvus]
MSEETLFQQFSFVRNHTLQHFDSLTEEVADQIPAGFRNNIRWNLGHIYVSLEGFLAVTTGQPANYPDGFADFFKGGSKPTDWTAEPPSLRTLKTLLEEQVGRVTDMLTGRLEEPLSKPFSLGGGRLVLNTMGEVLGFTLYHEGYHLGAISGLLRGIEGTR